MSKSKQTLYNTLNLRQLKKGSLFSKIHVLLPVFIITTVFGLGIISAHYFQYQINPDGTSYMQIAKRYAEGDFRGAINGYWSPLLSLLLIPFIWLSINPLLAVKIISLVSSLITVILFYRIIKYTKTPWWLTSSLIFTASSLLLGWSLVGPITSDILFVMSTVVSAYIGIHFLQKPTLLLATLFGLSGTLLYFSKAIGFYVFIFLLLAILLAKKNFNNLTIKKILVVLTVFLLLSLPYIIGISYKNRGFTISTAQTYNTELIKRFSALDQSYDHPINWSTIFIPIPENKFSLWEDPSLLVEQIDNRQPIERKDAIMNYEKSILNNFSLLLSSKYTFLIIFGLVFLIPVRRITASNKLEVTKHVLLLFVMANLAGVLLTVYEARYVYASIIICLVGVAFMLNKNKSILVSSSASVLIALSVVPIYGDIVENTSLERGLYTNAKLVSKNIPEGSTIISDSASSIYYCYYGNYRCMGNIPFSPDTVKYTEQFIKDNGIDYYLVTQPSTLEGISDKQLDELNIKLVTTFPTAKPNLAESP